MKKSGRISFVLLAVIVATIVAAIAFIILAGEESPETIGSEFLYAMAKGDTDGVSKLSYMDKATPQQIHDKWDYTLHTAGPYFRFTYQVTGLSRTSSDTCSVLVSWTKDANHDDAYSVNYQIPMIKVNGHWKVDVRSLNRDMFPGLPQ